MLKLVISDDEGKTTVVPLVRDEITIGRKEGNTIRLTERNVSRRHARIARRTNDYVLEDLASYNGIVVNGARLVEARSVRHGDQILIGDYKLQIVEEAGTQPAPQPPAPTPTPAEPIVPLLPPTPSTAPAAPAIPGLAPLNNPFAAPVAPGAAALGAASGVPDNIRSLRLVFLAPAGVPAPVPLDRLPLMMGRSEAADIPLPFSSISREHARLFIEDGKLMIEDMGSSNGVQVNGEKAKKAQVGPGDMVQLGVVEFRVARRGDSTVVIRAAAAEERERRQRSPLGLVMAVLGGGAALGLALFFAFRPKPTPPVNPPVTEAQPNTTAPTNPPAPPPTPTPVDPNNLPPAIPPPENTTPPPENTLGPNAPDPGGHVPENPTPTGDNPPTSENPGVEPPVVQQQLASNTRRNPPRRTTTTTTRPTQPTSQGTNGGSSTTTNPPPSSSGDSALDQARACLRGSPSRHEGNVCVINALRGRASSEQELNLLIATYNQENRGQEALRVMRTFVQRYPASPQTPHYQAQLSGE